MRYFLPILTIFLFIGVSNTGYAQYIGFDTKTIVTEDRGDGVKTYLKNLMVYAVDGGDWQGNKEKEHIPVKKSDREISGWGPIVDKGMEGLHVFFVDTTIDLPFKRDTVYDYQEFSYRRNCQTDEAVRLLLVEKYDTAKKAYFVDTMNITDTADICFCADKYYGNVKGLVVGIRVHDIGDSAEIASKSYFGRSYQIEVIKESLKADRVESDSLHGYGHDFFRENNGNIVFSNPDSSLDGRDTHVISILPYEAVKKRISIELSINTGVFVQPFTELKGGVFDSVTNERHRLILNLIDGNICVSSLAELVIKDDDIIKCNGGNISLSEQRSCVMLRDEATLEIGPQQHLEYGKLGKGILGLKPGATIHFDQGARMTIDNKLLLSDYWSTKAGGEIDITLGPGNELNFGEYASVTNGPFEHGSVIMNIHLKGGRANLGNLDEKSRELINLVYYDEFSREMESTELYPNPAQTELNLSFKSETTSQVQATIVQSNGKVIYNEPIAVFEDVNTLTFDVSGLEQGIYLLHLKSSGKAVSKTFLIR